MFSGWMEGFALDIAGSDTTGSDTAGLGCGILATVATGCKRQILYKYF